MVKQDFEKGEALCNGCFSKSHIEVGTNIILGVYYTIALTEPVEPIWHNSLIYQIWLYFRVQSFNFYEY